MDQPSPNTNNEGARRRVDVRVDSYEADYPAEYERLRSTLEQTVYEFRASRGVAEQPETAAIGHVRKGDSTCIITSRRDGQVGVTIEGEDRSFEADFAAQQPFIREYVVAEEDGAVDEVVPGEDEAGCQIIASFARILMAASLDTNR